MKILGTVACISINPVVATTLKLKEDVSFIAIPNEVLHKFHAKKFDVINSDNELILVAQPESQATSENKPPTKEIVS